MTRHHVWLYAGCVQMRPHTVSECVWGWQRGRAQHCKGARRARPRVFRRPPFLSHILTLRTTCQPLTPRQEVAALETELQTAVSGLPGRLAAISGGRPASRNALCDSALWGEAQTPAWPKPAPGNTQPAPGNPHSEGLPPRLTRHPPPRTPSCPAWSTSCSGGTGRASGCAQRTRRRSPTAFDQSRAMWLQSCDGSSSPCVGLLPCFASRAQEARAPRPQRPRQGAAGPLPRGAACRLPGAAWLTEA
ncbi:MAG: hypothetical protein J3K34DRAFT_160361 [Monoraphidium minutum]|nr:MAG: hypothetical protein J3K34DRAFT_160361 [Monoraphidium minutum]